MATQTDSQVSAELTQMNKYAEKIDSILKPMVHVLFTEQPDNPLEVCNVDF